jgi:hypothetical protein
VKITPIASKLVVELTASEAQQVETALYALGSNLAQSLYPADQEEAERVMEMADLVAAARRASFKGG